MTPAEVMEALEAAGTEQNRKVYRRHGAQDPMFGVSYAVLGTLKKRIRCDQALAEALWQTGNHDARILATMVADPATVAAATLDAWAAQANGYGQSGSLASELVVKTPYAWDKHRTWIEATDEWTACAGWRLLAELALRDKTVADDVFVAALERIEREIQAAPNRVRYEMNGALIAIGGRDDRLAERAMAAAQRIGKVVVDHGETACQTPDALPYIQKMRKRASAKQQA
jgi:3-methyladenine DNA glycosylase AlkD